MTKRDLTEADLMQREYEVPEMVDFYQFAEYFRITEPEALSVFAREIELGRDDLITEVFLQPMNLSHEGWRAQLAEDIFLTRYQLDLMDTDRYQKWDDPTLDLLLELDFDKTSTEELLSILFLERLTLAKYQGNTDAQKLHQTLDWASMIEQLPVRGINLTTFNHEGSAYAPWREVYAVILRLKDYEAYRSSMLPDDGEIEIPEGEFICDIIRWDPTLSSEEVMVRRAKEIQKYRDPLINSGYWFAEVSAEEIQGMERDELIALIAYYEILAWTVQKDKDMLTVWTQIDPLAENPVRVVEINGRSLSDRVEDRIENDEGLPSKFMRTYLAFAKKRKAK